MLTFTKMPGPPCWHSLGCGWLAGLAEAVVGLIMAVNIGEAVCFPLPSESPCYEPSCRPSFEASSRHSSSSPCKPKCKFPNFIFHRVLNLNLWPQSPFQISSIELIWLFSLELQLRFTDRYAFVPCLCKLAKILPIIHIFWWFLKKYILTPKFECIVCEMYTLKIVLG